MFGQIPKLEDGLVLYRAGRLSEAVQTFEAVRTRGQNTPLLDFYQGVSLAKLGDLPGATRLLLGYTSAVSGDAHGWYWLSRVQLLQRQFPEARASAQRAIELDPNSGESYRTLGEVELELRNNEAAYRAWVTANKLNPADPQTAYHLGRLFFAAEFFEESSGWLRETLRLTPTHFAAMTYLGLCAEHLGSDDTATGLYRRAIELSKLQKAPYALAYLSYARLLRKKGQDGEAVALLEESERLCPDANALALLGQLLATEHETVRAEAVLRRALQIDPQISEVHYRLSLLLRSKGKAEEAEREMALFKQAKESEERNKMDFSAIRVPARLNK